MTLARQRNGGSGARGAHGAFYRVRGGEERGEGGRQLPVARWALIVRWF
jgi:hypothetical protein